jgi:hypothetical protein
MSAAREHTPARPPREISPEEFLANAGDELRFATEHGSLIIRDAAGRMRMQIWVPQDDDAA